MKKRKLPTDQRQIQKKVPREDSFPIVGIGASAGGLKAFEQLLQHLPSDTGMAFLLVQHLDPKHESRLTDILARHTSMPVTEVKDGMRLAPNHLFVIPPNTADLAVASEGLRREQVKRVGAEEAVRAGEERFQVVADSLTELISFVDTEERYQFCNKSYERNLGISPNEFMGHTVREVLGEAVYATFKPFIQKALGGQFTSYEGYVLHEKFGRRYLQIDYIPQRDQRGKIDGFYSVIRNLTELKEAEEKFRGVVDASPNAILLHDKEGKITLVNPQTERIFGYTQKELIGQTIEIIVPDRFRKMLIDYRTAYSKMPVVRPMGKGLELYAVRKDGSELPVEISLPSVETTKGTVVASIIHDLTERYQLAEQTRWATILEERSRMARDIHDTLAQEFSGIVLNLEAAEEAAEAAKNLPEQVRNRIGRARDVARQSLEEVRRSVLAMSSPLPVRGDLANSIRAFVSSYASTARTRVDFSVKGTSRHLGPAIEENLLRIAQQATDNALKHARASVIHIQLRFDEKTVRLSITDDGQGFDVKKESRGFGVTGMRERAREIGGKFRLDSKHGKGTRVEAAVPLSPARPPEASR